MTITATNSIISLLKKTLIKCNDHDAADAADAESLMMMQTSSNSD